jgi:regulator of replication initiation timing
LETTCRKNKDKKENSPQSNVSQQEMQQLQIQMGEMMEQNHKLMKELESRKQSPSNVVEFKEESASKRSFSS